MELEEIKEIARKEKGRDLRPIANDFYEQAEVYVRSLERNMEEIGRPRSPEYKMVEDQLTSAVSDIETIFMRRIGKVIDRATSSAFSSAGTGLLRKDFDKLLPAERRLYEAVYQAILISRRELAASILDGDRDGDGHGGGPARGPAFSGKKESVQPSGESGDKLLKKGIGSLDSLPRRTAAGSGAPAGPGTPAGSDVTAVPGAQKRPAGSSASGVSLGISSASSPAASSSPPPPASPGGPAPSGRRENDMPAAPSGNNIIYHGRVVVRLLSDVPEFRGEDKRNYRVRAQDVVSLPAANASILVRRQVARLITGSFGA